MPPNNEGNMGQIPLKQSNTIGSILAKKNIGPITSMQIDTIGCTLALEMNMEQCYPQIEELAFEGTASESLENDCFMDELNIVDTRCIKLQGRKALPWGQMRITSWNVRGLAAPDKRRLVKRTLIRLDSDVYIFQETKMCKEKAEDFVGYYYKWGGIFCDAIDMAGGLGIMWNPSKADVHLIASSNKWMACNITCKQMTLYFPLLNIYGPVKIEDKLAIWMEITNLIYTLGSNKVIAARDFNALLSLYEKAGGLQKPTKVMEDFKCFVSNNKLVDIIPQNGSYTWTNRRLNFLNISEWLDHFLAGEGWINGNLSLESQIFPQVGSDHMPISLFIDQEIRCTKNYFKFLSTWW
ncbi:hypothetical protein SUGI_0882540 [Cryptomeria japonica]|nr:hypothetical protein SUGI_0882540 [Cryptomeria japonica]